MINRSPASSSKSIPIIFFMAWRNIWRNPVRSALTISALVGGLVVMVLYSALLEGMMRQMVRHATEISTGHIQIHRQAFAADQDLYATLPSVYLTVLERQFPQLNIAPRLYSSALASSAQTSTGVMIRAVDPQREVLVTSMLKHIREGEPELDIAAPDASPGADGKHLLRYNLIIGSKLARNMNLIPGSELILVTQAADGSIGNALFRVAAIFKPLEPNFDRSGVLMSVEAYQQLMYLENGFHELVIKLADGNQLEAVQEKLNAALYTLQADQPLDQLGGNTKVRNWRQLTPMVADMLELSQSMMLIIGLIVIGLASMGILNTMLMAIHERSHEFGILLAIGMKRRLLLLMVLFETLLLALISALIGSVAGLAITRYLEPRGIDFSQTMPDGYDWAGMVFEPVMDIYLEPSHIVSACLLMIAVALLTSVIPCWSIVRLKPVEVMR